MSDNYSKLVVENVDRLYRKLPPDLAVRIGAHVEGDVFCFNAFGDPCRLSPEGIQLGGRPVQPILGILISLYALHAGVEARREAPFRAFKEFSGSMPYTGAFGTHTERILSPHVPAIQKASDRIRRRLDGEAAPGAMGGDFSLIVRPLPKLSLCYIFYHSDEEFPASATCLFSNNADAFMPIDGLADIGEYTSKRIISVSGQSDAGTYS